MKPIYITRCRFGLSISFGTIDPASYVAGPYASTDDAADDLVRRENDQAHRRVVWSTLLGVLAVLVIGYALPYAISDERYQARVELSDD